MAFATLLKAGLKKQKGTLAGLAVLFFVISVSLVLALSVSANSGSYVREQMTRLGYGNLTAWVSGVSSTGRLAAEVESLDDVEKVGVQPFVFSGYTINGKHSDDEGQILAYDSARYPYFFLNKELDGYRQAPQIKPGEIWLSPAMQSSYDVRIGDEVHFALSRGAEETVFVVAGWFEDPFMGSSMIDRKSFLVNSSDFAKLREQLTSITEFNALARYGAMLHVFQSPESDLAPTEFSTLLNTHTALPDHTEFLYTDASIYGFMMILQNIFTGFLGAFAAILTAVAIVVLGHSITSAIEQDRRDLAVLKTEGCTGAQLRLVQSSQYAVGILSGLLPALLCSAFFSKMLSRMTVTSAGLLMPSGLSWGRCLACLTALFGVFVLWTAVKTGAIARIAPVRILRGEEELPSNITRGAAALTPRCLAIRLAVRQIVSGKRRYFGTFIIAVLLVFFVSSIFRMNAWLGPKGEGLMNAFSVADHDLGVQPLREVDMGEIEDRIRAYADIKGTYEVAMQSASVNGVDVTANVLDKPSWYHILSGHTCEASDEVVLTRTIAEELGARVGSSVTVAHAGHSAVYQVSGIYQCANGMGYNIGMNRDGYAKIGSVNGYIWCRHYVLSDSSRNEEIMEEIQHAYRMEVAVHTNSWSGLDGIVNTLHWLTLFMGVIVTLFVAVAVALTGSRLLAAEQRDMAVYKSIGFPPRRLRAAFAARFGIVVACGSAVGTACSVGLSDRVITGLLRLFGIGEFHIDLSLFDVLLPAVFVTVLFTLFAYAVSRRIRKVDVPELLGS